MMGAAAGGDRALTTLRRCDLFRSLGDEAVSRLGRHLVRRRYRKGEVVFHQGDPGVRLHVIATGRVRVGIESDDGRAGTLTVLGPGAMFGELVLLDGAPRSAGATAIEATETVTLDRASFRRLVDEDPEIREAVLVGVARWVRRLTDQMTELHFLDLRGRVAATLVRLAKDAGAVPHGPVTLPPLTQGDLASLVAATRQRVNEALGELARDGLISIDGRRTTIPDLAALEASIGRRRRE